MTVSWGRTTKIFPVAEWILYWPCQETELEMEYRCSQNNCNSIRSLFQPQSIICFRIMLYYTLLTIFNQETTFGFE